MRAEVKRENGYWSVYVWVERPTAEGGRMRVRCVDRESYQVACNIEHALNHPSEAPRSESTEVAESIRRWAESR